MEFKNKFNTILKAALLIAGIACFISSHGKEKLTLKINEILVLNDSNYVDDFGQHVPWFELFNASYNSMDISGMYLTDDLNNPKKYWIPTGDPMTSIPPRGYIVFFADNHPTRGILHLNFTLTDKMTLAVFSSNGKTLIDSVTINLPQKPDVSFGRIKDGGPDWGFLSQTTPNANNDASQKATAGEAFVKMDPTGLGMTFIAMFVVFVSLALLYIIYKNMGRYFIRKGRKSIIAEHKATKATTLASKEDEDISGELNAAIAMALYLYQNELHDLENTVLTIRKTSRNYSPWSSKIYTIRKYPNN